MPFLPSITPDTPTGAARPNHEPPLEPPTGSRIGSGMILLLAWSGPAVVAFALAWLVRGTVRMSSRSRYRWAVAGGVAVAILIGLVPALAGVVARGTVVPSLLLGIAGALAGALGSSSLEFGIIENTFPPADDIQREVLQAHKARFGHPPPLRISKRAFDIALSLVALVLTAPVWILIGLLIWLEDPGPLVFVKNSVGRGGHNFPQLKFRTMVRNAEVSTGPIPARREDERVLTIGRFLRRTALDELPQLVNILAGQMSFVGPRPLRTVVEREYLHDLPEFADRHKVQPGLAGLAQVVASYYVPLRSRLRLDRLYAENASLLLDLALIWSAVLIVFWFRWQPEWQGRLPRRWLHRRVRRAF